MIPVNDWLSTSIQKGAKITELETSIIILFIQINLKETHHHQLGVKIPHIMPHIKSCAHGNSNHDRSVNILYNFNSSHCEPITNHASGPWVQEWLRQLETSITHRGSFGSIKKNIYDLLLTCQTQNVGNFHITWEFTQYHVSHDWLNLTSLIIWLAECHELTSYSNNRGIFWDKWMLPMSFSQCTCMRTL